jgi:N-acetylmuramoyl-L-alanine amidase
MKFVPSKLPIGLLVLLLPAAGGAAVEHVVPASYANPDPVAASLLGAGAASGHLPAAALDVAPAIEASATTDVAEVPSVNQQQAVCMAKVIVHEAGNQPYRGQLAVAQVIRNRIRDGRFGRNACSVVSQRGQFFNVDAYEPSRSNGRWQTAYKIAHTTLAGAGEEIVPGALFFRSGGPAFRGRKYLASVADHHFYR